MDDNKLLNRAILRRAVGYDATETVEEYVECDGEMKLVKKKVSHKNIPPDVAAARLLKEEGDKEPINLTDKELEEEKRRLLRSLKEAEDAKR